MKRERGIVVGPWVTQHSERTDSIFGRDLRLVSMDLPLQLSNKFIGLRPTIFRRAVVDVCCTEAAEIVKFLVATGREPPFPSPE